ncbi:MAG: HTTM domain-containing protein [Proteobacteria bacterium]|nr:HTTM domain-containing protein [Pseudomonadota bacterium]
MGPHALAALRIVVAVLWLILPAVRTSPGWAEIPAVSMPWGSAWLLPWLDTSVARVAQAGVWLGASLGLLGVGARFGFALVTLCGAYLLAIPQFHGGVQHYHHLLWFAALLAVSPASDAWTARRWRPVSGRSVGWGVPTHIAWLLLALIYFFPGVHKLRVQGLDWAGDNLTLLLYWKWAQSWDFVPLTRIDRWPTLLWLGGLAVLAFEIGAPLWIATRRLRLVFVCITGLFHLATMLWFNIEFWVLWVCFIVMWPFAEPDDKPVKRPFRPAVAMGGVLLGGVLLSGLTATTQGWPFACYPTFEQPIDEWMPSLEIVGIDAEGDEWPVPERALADAQHSQAFYSEVWGLSGLYGTRSDIAVEHFWRRVEPREDVQAVLGDAETVELQAVVRSVRPGVEDTRSVRVLGTFERAAVP